MIVVVDYGVGNLRSVENMLRKAQAACAVSGDPDVILKADKLILPGVGHFAHGMQRLTESGLIEPLNQFALELRRPVLGICLGAQILGRGSEEAPGTSGLGWVEMECRRFSEQMGLPVPHMGWNTVEVCQDNPLLPRGDDEQRYYFVHSYHMVCDRQEDVVGTTVYGQPFTSAVRNGNVLGTQFHPEKSHRFGLALIRAYAQWQAEALEPA